MEQQSSEIERQWLDEEKRDSNGRIEGTKAIWGTQREKGIRRRRNRKGSYRPGMISACSN